MDNQIIFGTHPLMGNDLAIAVREAISAGYRTFDTAQMYGNEGALGIALKNSGLKRVNFKVTTKITPQNYHSSRLLPSLRHSLDRLQLDHVDLLLLHFPPQADDLNPCLIELASARDAGLAASIGVSNFTAEMMRQAAAFGVDLSVNQIEFHPLIDGKRLIDASLETSISLQAFSPLARGAVLRHPKIVEIAARYHRLPAQIVFRWIIGKGLPVVTHSANPKNIRSNIESASFDLDQQDISEIDKLSTINYRVVTRDYIMWAPNWDGPGNSE